METISLYKRKKYGKPILCIIFIMSILIVSVCTYFNRNLFELFAEFSPKPLHFWQYFTSFFEHSLYGIGGYYFIFIHMATNISVILLFGIIVEKMFGLKKLILLSIISGAAQQILFVYICRNRQNYGAGASGIVFAYIPVALYFILKVIEENKKKSLKEPLIYIYFIELCFVWGVISITSTWQGTNIYHFTATIIGIIFLFINKKTADKEFEDFKEKPSLVMINNNRTKYLLLIVPVILSIIIILYYFGVIKVKYNWYI